ncbi:TetR/AcrR family transcriptional regulator [Mycobacterium talmoniae]|uniref:TetR family transcriptional regulator n=1 Tax=Mycobacterium talmoniae TaxID=1858794 RepID=A0A1S1NPR8_9MYCO|nr:TetR/AcrR family transcriptional regulator [Mycobacterium talmoniae]OHV06523.1 TetR family transcriptional regulator [Mycobacterium talmoniae]
MLGEDGDRGLSHPKVDRRARMPPGTTSFYYRTRKALLQGAAARLTELDVADLSRMVQAAHDPPGPFSGTAGLAKMVMISATEPWLTRAKARYELMLQASRDPDLGATVQQTTALFHQLAREVVGQWHPPGAAPDPGLLEEQAAATLAFVNGVMMGFVIGGPVIDDEARLDRLLQALLAAIADSYRR